MILPTGTDAARGYYAEEWVFWIQIVLMGALQVLCVFWLFLILRIMLIVVTKGGSEASDDREEDEEQGEVGKMAGKSVDGGGRGGDERGAAAGGGGRLGKKVPRGQLMTFFWPQRRGEKAIDPWNRRNHSGVSRR